MKKILNLIFEFSVPLIAGIIVALIWVNLSPADYHAFVDKPFAETHAFGQLSLRFVTNEIFMVFFFGLATVEITQACLPGGDLNPPGSRPGVYCSVLSPPDAGRGTHFHCRHH